jgi:hypothetical protein
LKRPPTKELLDFSPTFFALRMIASAVRDSPPFLTITSENFLHADEVESECHKTKLPTAIIQLENNQLGVMSQSILFIQGLTPGKLLLSLK